jgi:hypothetical protein
MDSDRSMAEPTTFRTDWKVGDEVWVLFCENVPPRLRYVVEFAGRVQAVRPGGYRVAGRWCSNVECPVFGSKGDADRYVEANPSPYGRMGLGN